MAQDPVAPAEDKAAARTNGQDRKGTMHKGKDTAAQDDGAGDHAYLAFQGLLATACHGKAGFFPCFPAAFQSMGRAPWQAGPEATRCSLSCCPKCRRR